MIRSASKGSRCRELTRAYSVFCSRTMLSRLTRSRGRILSFTSALLESSSRKYPTLCSRRLLWLNGFRHWNRSAVVARIRSPEHQRGAHVFHNLVVIAEKSDHQKEMIITSFDPIKGRGSERLRFKLDPQGSGWCDLSPDGSKIAAIVGRDEPIKIFSLHGQPTHVIPARGLDHMMLVSWAADGKGLFVTHEVKAGSELVYVDLKGNTKALWRNNVGLQPWSLQSPDGRYLAIQNSTYNGNMWMMENF